MSFVNVSVSFSLIIIEKHIIANSCTNGQVRLHDGDSQRRGNLQICSNSTWQAVCGQGNSRVDNNLASVVCSALGYSRYGIK